MLIGLISAFVQMFPKISDSKLAWLLLAVVNVVLWAVIGTLGGFVLAFFTYLFEPQGQTQGRVAVVVFLLTVLFSIVTGLVVSWKGYRRQWTSTS